MRSHLLYQAAQGHEGDIRAALCWCVCNLCNFQERGWHHQGVEWLIDKRGSSWVLSTPKLGQQSRGSCQSVLLFHCVV